MARFLGIDFAPLNIPLDRRFQTLCVLHYMLFLVLTVFFTLGVLLLLLTQYYWISLGYLAWIYYDVKIACTSSRGGRRINWLRRSPHMKYMRDYFPISLIKTTNLDPDKNYIFGYHPHGIIGHGAFCNFASEATGFSEKFPGITPHILTLKVNFLIPILRGYLLWMGACDVSRESLEWILTKQGKGNAAVIVIGGADEALEAHPGKHCLTLKTRKGFVKIAMKTGADLVPVFSFGENELFDQAENPKGSLLRSFQDHFKSMFGFSPVFFYGRGIFNYSLGIMPYRYPVNTLVGTPIPVKQTSTPEQEDIDTIHQQYMDQLTKMFEENKVKYGLKEDAVLTFV